MSRRLLICAALTLTIPLAACTKAPEPPGDPAPPGPQAIRLVSFDSCAQLIAELRKTAKANVGPYGLPGNMTMATAVAQGGARTAADSAAIAAPAAPQQYSGTNVHEQGADEPDIVKTDGRRIVTVSRGVLYVVDAATHRQTGRLALGAGRALEPQVFLSGDAALVLVPNDYSRPYLADEDGPVNSGPQVLLVNLAGEPSIVSRYHGEGSLIDARMTGSTARVVLRSSPRIRFSEPSQATDPAKRIATNQSLIDKTPDAAWLPRWEVTDRTGTTKGQVDCGRVSRPTDYSGGTMVSVLTFDLTRPTLGSGDPVAVAADADTVYGTADSLYLAGDNRWRYDLLAANVRFAAPRDQKAELFKFTIAGNQPPVYRAGGTVPGYLLNQYSLSEWDGHLRVVTTSKDRSAVRVLTERGGKLAQTGIVDGIGKGESVYSVRFLGDRGYVVTFRQTDPLYSLDLSDPANPRITGELKINGYSAHLQPVGENRLIGIGQEADDAGRAQGLQVSLFDVADPAHPKRLARYHVGGASSNAEYDPHALLWWPATGTLVVPLSGGAGNGAVALQVTGDDIKLADRLSQPATTDLDADPAILRSLVIGDQLWTLSKIGLQATELSTMDAVAWMPLKN